MSNPSHNQDKVWDSFFDFVFSDDDQLTREEVQQELHHYGIDAATAVSKVQAALQSRRAQAKLVLARRQRNSVTTKLFGVVCESACELRDNMKQFIEKKMKGQGQFAYFRKLEQAASDEDLESLMDDLAKLDALTDNESQNNDE